MTESAEIEVQEARLEDQGRLGALLQKHWKPTLERELAAAAAAGAEVPPVDDELMAADDFYFSRIDLMNCCYFARAGDETIGVAAVNPYTTELQFVVVEPAWRRRGIGRRLVECCLKELRTRGVGHVKADLPAALADAGAEAFLRAVGFGEIRRTVRLGRRVG